MSDTSNPKEQSFIRRFWWLILLLIILLVLLCVFIGPAIGAVLFPQNPTAQPTEPVTQTTGGTQPPCNALTAANCVTQPVTQPPCVSSTDKNCATQSVTQPPCSAATNKNCATQSVTQPPGEQPTEVVTQKATEPPCSPTNPNCATQPVTQSTCLNPNDNICDPACEDPGNDPNACGGPKCGSNCSITGYCGDPAGGWACTGGTCDAPQCNKQPPPPKPAW